MLITNKTENLNRIDLTKGATVLINKELNWTSFDIVAKLRSMVGKKFNNKKLKVGHGGTLDPLADGLVVIGIGPHTKQLQTFQDEGKEYIAEIKFGATTPSYDRETEENQQFEIKNITEESIRKVLAEQFTGTISQMPPIFSAKSVNGTRAYELARKGQEVALSAVNITISKIELLNIDMPYATIHVACSKGTYIRSLANDIGQALGSGAYMTKLTRTRSGGFMLQDAMTVDEFRAALAE